MLFYQVESYASARTPLPLRSSLASPDGVGELVECVQGLLS
jgi:hypothetical protein